MSFFKILQKIFLESLYFKQNEICIFIIYFDFFVFLYNIRVWTVIREWYWKRGQWSNNHYQHSLKLWEDAGSGGGLTVSFVASDQSGNGAINATNHGSANTGGGGGASDRSANGGNGGSGIVIIRYAV